MRAAAEAPSASPAWSQPAGQAAADSPCRSSRTGCSRRTWRLHRDSGGPVFEDRQDGPVIVGVISWSTGPNGTAGCGGLTGVTPLTLIADWILQTARQWGSALLSRGGLLSLFAARGTLRRRRVYLRRHAACGSSLRVTLMRCVADVEQGAAALLASGAGTLVEAVGQFAIVRTLSIQFLRAFRPPGPARRYRSLSWRCRSSRTRRRLCPTMLSIASPCSPSDAV